MLVIVLVRGANCRVECTGRESEIFCRQGAFEDNDYGKNRYAVFVFSTNKAKKKKKMVLEKYLLRLK